MNSWEFVSRSGHIKDHIVLLQQHDGSELRGHLNATRVNLLCATATAPEPTSAEARYGSVHIVRDLQEPQSGDSWFTETLWSTSLRKPPFFWFMPIPKRDWRLFLLLIYLIQIHARKYFASCSIALCGLKNAPCTQVPLNAHDIVAQHLKIRLKRWMEGNVTKFTEQCLLLNK